MNTEKINIVLAEGNPDMRTFFSTVFNDLKLPVSYTIYNDGQQVLNHLDHTFEPLHLIFLNVDSANAGLECLKIIRKAPEFSDICIAVYSDGSMGNNFTDIFIAGANIYIEKPDFTEQFEKIIKQIISVNWQYVVDGLDREKFMLKF